MPERVIARPPDATWDPDTPNAVLLSNDLGRTALALEPHPDDDDPRSVVLVWEGVRSAGLGDPSSEALSSHRLYASGLSSLVGVGVVEDSALIRSLEEQSKLLPFHQPEWFTNLEHHVVSLREGTVEVVAASLTTVRIGGTTMQAAVAASTETSKPVEQSTVI